MKCSAHSSTDMPRYACVHPNMNGDLRPTLRQPSVAGEVIRSEKSWRVEGRYGECLARDTLMAPFEAELTADWFVCRNAAGSIRNMAKVLVPGTELSKSERAIAASMERRGFGLTQITVCNGCGQFLAAPYTGSELSKRWVHFLPPASTNHAKQDAVAKAIVDRGIRWLIERGDLHSYALNREFGRRSRRIVCDLDFVWNREDGDPVVIDVKAKSPSADGCFGINEAPASVYSSLLSVGIPVVQLILDKSRGRKERYLLIDRDALSGAEWRAKSLSFRDLTGAVRQAPKWTSLTGSRWQPYRAVPADSYEQFGTLERPLTGKFESWIRRLAPDPRIKV